MPDTVARTEQLWVAGKRQSFAIYHADSELSAINRGNGTHDKDKIVLHYTASPYSSDSSRTANEIIGGWNAKSRDDESKKVGTQFILERAENRADSSHIYSDAVQTIHGDAQQLRWNSTHCSLSRPSIGIEIINTGVFGRRVGENTRPYTSESDLPAEIRADNNSYFHLSRFMGNCGRWFYQAYQNEQYEALKFLLRYLCIEFQIPRIFIGRNAQQNLAKYGTGSGNSFNPSATARRFSGVLSHCNIHGNKACGGPALIRNRIYRSISDEWWLPVNLGSETRGYYTGPFADGRDLVRADNIGSTTTLRNADINFLQQTRSYFNLSSNYFNHVEGSQGGHYPVATNQCWHTGVHFAPSGDNANVYAAASGTIVAARISSDERIERAVGSPRFVLIKHSVYTQISGGRLNYSANPRIVFSLYMHLGAMTEDTNTPEWFNIWCQGGGDRNPSGVFCPDIEVMVGDCIGTCGQWYDQTCLHFEIFSTQWFNIPPWRGFSGNPFESDEYKYSLDTLGPISDAILSGDYSGIRNCACRRPTEWARWTDGDLQEVVPSSRDRAILLPEINHMAWYEDARSASSELSGDLPDNAVLVYYHPIVFMKRINQLLNQQGDFAGGAPAWSGGASAAARSSTGPVMAAARRPEGGEGSDAVETLPPFRFSI